MRIPRRRATRIALGAAGAIVAVLILAQLLLPSLAVRRVRDELARYGVVRSATVSAFPAIQLLWGNAQSATIRAGNLNMGLSQASELLWKARGVNRVDMSSESMRLGSVTMHGVHMHKQGSSLYIQGSATNFQGLVPGGVEVQPLEKVPGGVKVRVSGNLFGAQTSTEAVLGAQEGSLVAQPQGIPFAGYVKETMFSDPHIYLLDFDLTRPVAANGDPKYLIRIWAKLQ
ncbi:MAG TPA: hypothetical protein VNY52_13315 [Solirubrobacteraceae bacterium]|jgi:hypothetical protein|nr:hypothetical protein [Solirubrobacteraceae bacterium]